jgi:hypothetical protein
MIMILYWKPYIHGCPMSTCKSDFFHLNPFRGCIELVFKYIIFEGFTHVYILFRQLLKHETELVFALFLAKFQL